MAKNKYGFSGNPFKDCVVPVPSPQGGAGSFGSPVEGGPKPTSMPIKPVQFADVAGGSAGSKGYGPGKKK